MLKLTERQCLLKALILVKDRMRFLNNFLGDELSNSAYEEWRSLTDTSVYLENKLIELNQKEGLYEHQDSYRQREQGDNAVSVRERGYRE